MKKSIIRLNCFLSLGFGVIMGILFPVYAGFFVEYKSPRSQVIFTAGCLLAGILVGVCAFLINRGTVISLIRKVVKHVESLSGGDADLTRRIPIESHDELGELPRQFNSFIEEIRSLVDLTQGSMTQVKDTGDSLIHNMTETRQAVHSIEYVINNVGEKIQRQQADIAENRQAGELVSKTVLAAVTHVLELYNQMNQLTSQLLDQSEVMEQILLGIKSLAVNIKGDKRKNEIHLQGFGLHFMDQMEHLLNQDRESYGKLAEFISRIEDISHRTGVLAINASIEAAHSGKEGEGFKVIAQGIRILSNEAESLSTQIGTALRNSVKSMENSREELQEAKKNYALIFERVRENLDGVQEKTSDVKNQTDTLQGSYKQVHGMLKMIRSSLGELETSTRRSMDIIQTLEQSSLSIGKGMGEIDKEVENIAEMALKTSTQVERINRAIIDVDTKIMTFRTREEE